MSELTRRGLFACAAAAVATACVGPDVVGVAGGITRHADLVPIMVQTIRFDVKYAHEPAIVKETWIENCDESV